MQILTTVFPFLLFLVVVVIVLGLFARLKGKQVKQSDYPYVKQASLVSPAERSFLGVLEQALSVDYKVFTKVRLADIIKVKSGLDNSARTTAFNKISAKHIDFVVCSATDMSIVQLVELDDKSHQKQQARDAFVDAALQAAGIPLLRVPAKQAYSVTEVREKLAALTTLESQPEAVNSPVGDADPVAKDEGQACPKCGSQMVIRTAKRGERAGQDFWACSAYPKCRTILSLNDVLA